MPVETTRLDAAGSAAAGLRLLRAPDAGPAGWRLAVAAEAARARVPAATGQAEAVRDVTAAIAAPILVAYVLWLLLDARDRGLARLCFLSRDGQVLKDIADVLAPRLGIAIERRYLQASRQAWNRALGPAHFDRWLWNDLGAEPTLGALLRRLDVPAAAVAGDIAGLGLDPDAPLDPDDAARVRQWLASDRFAAAAGGALAGNRALLTGYFAQEGLHDRVPMAIVDLGWSGSQHETLCDLLTAQGLPPCACYLFGAKAKTSAWSGLRRGFYFDEGAAAGTGTDGGGHALPPRDLYALMETFCTAAEGTLTGFARTGGRIVPVVAPDRTAALDAWGLPVLRATLLAAAEAFTAEPDEVARMRPGDLLALHGTIGGLLEAFWEAPAPAEARAWGSFPWDAGQGHEPEVFPLADPYTLADMQAAWTPKRLRKREIFWVGGALAMTPPAVAAALRGTTALRTRLGRLRRSARDLGRGGLRRSGALPALMLLPL